MFEIREIFREIYLISYFIIPLPKASRQMWLDFALVILVYVRAQGDAFVIAQGAVGFGIAVLVGLHGPVFEQGLFYGDFGVPEKMVGIDLADLCFTKAGVSIQNELLLLAADLLAFAPKAFFHGLK